VKSDFAQHDSNDSHPDRPQIQRRQAWKVIMAIVLIWIAAASTSDGGDPCLQPETHWPSDADWPIQYDGFTPLLDRDQGADGDPRGLQDSATALAAYVQLQARLSNFDADADPDGWQAAVVLRNRDGLPLALPARATFEILEYARSSDQPFSGQRVSAGQRVTRSIPSTRWTVPLLFDQQRVATVTLPAPRSIQHSFGWDSIGARQVGQERARENIAGRYDRFSSERMSRLSRPRYNQHFLTLELSDAIDFPEVGWLRVRVSIPGQQALEATAPIELRPPVLVDITGGYR